MNKLWVIILCCSLYSIMGIAQNLTIKVELNPPSSSTLIEVYHQESNLIIEKQPESTLTIPVSKGIQHVTLLADNYETTTYALDITGDTTITCQMNKLNINLAEIEVIEKRKELFGTRTLNDIEGTSVYAGKKSEVVILDNTVGNLAINRSRQVFAQVSGLNIYEGNEGGLQLNIGGRGLDPNRTSNFNTRQNGYDISADVLGYPENYYTPPAEALSEIRVIRGASSLQYGTQFGGLIDFRIKKIPRFKKYNVFTAQTYGSFNTFSTFNYAGINLGSFSINGYVNYKASDGYRASAEYSNTNSFISIDYHVNSRTKIGLEATFYNYLAQQAGGLTDSQFAENSRLSTRDRNWFGVDWKLYNLNFSHDLRDNSILSISAFALDAERNAVGFRGNPGILNENPITALDEQTLNGEFITPRDLLINEFNNIGAEIKYLKPYTLGSLNVTGLLGAKYYKSDNTALQSAGSTGIDADFSSFQDDFPDYPNFSNFEFPNNNVSVFTEHIIHLKDNLSIIPGLRFENIITRTDGIFNNVIRDNANNPIFNETIDETNDLERSFVLLGLGASYKPSTHVEWIANLSQNYRSVTFSDIRVVNPSFVIDSLIRDERGFTFDIGLRARLDNFFAINTSLYSVLYDDRIGIIINSRAQRERKNIGTALIAGSETLVNLNIAKWLWPEKSNFKLDHYSNFAFTFSEYLSSEENNVVGKKVEFIPSFNLKSGLTLGYKGFNISYQFTFLTQQFTDVQNSRISAAGDVREGIIGEIPAYTVSDLTLDYTYKQYKLSCSINNLWDQAYFTRRATGYPGPGIIPSEGRGVFVTLSADLD